MSLRDAAVALGAQLDAALQPRLRRGEPVVLLGFPNHPNPGDAAIWRGERAWLRRNGNPVTYVAGVDTYSRDEAVRRARGATVLLGGGGDFGDLYPRAQDFRERVIADLRDVRLIQLPQSVWFRDGVRAERCRRLLAAHPDFTFMVRDARSAEIAKRTLGAHCVLCPDMAFALGPLPRVAEPQGDLLWLSRRDREARGWEIPNDPGVLVADWHGPGELRWERHATVRRRAWRMLGALGRARVAGPLVPLLWRVLERRARGHVRRGQSLLARGRVVITDRLHGHVLCLLMGIPHVLLDNSYGKLDAFHRTWTADLELVRWANSAREALESARALAARGAVPPTGDGG